MKIFVLKALPMMFYGERMALPCDSFMGFSIAADDESEARKFAADKDGSGWLDPICASCEEVTSKGIFLEDFFNG